MDCLILISTTGYQLFFKGITENLPGWFVYNQLQVVIPLEISSYLRGIFAIFLKWL